MIISGFPGVGKTTFAKKYPDLAIDLESSEFHYDLANFRKKGLNAEQMKGLQGRIEKKNWEEKYAKVAVDLNEKYKFVFVANNRQVIYEILKLDVSPLIVIPSHEDYEIYKRRYKNRGNNSDWIARTMADFNKNHFREKEKLFGKKCKIVHLQGDATLEDLLFSDEFKNSHD